MEKENEQKIEAGRLIPLTSSLVYQVVDEDGKLINCQTLNEALILSYLVKIWKKLDSKN